MLASRFVWLAAPVAVIACTPFGEESAASGDGGTSACDAATSGCAAPACTGDECAAAVSCKTLHELRSDLPDGIYSIDTDGSGPLPPVGTYCDMTTDGGGWTLVARSVKGKALASDFGWREDHGKVDDDAEPFSFEVTPLGIAFTEILFGARGEGKTWDTPVYKHTVPADFVSTQRNKGVSTTGPSTVLGACRPEQGPSMLSVVGFTMLSDHFAFTDDPGNPAFGLWADGWDTNGAFANATNLCSYTGELTGKQGMLFVR